MEIEYRILNLYKTKQYHRCIKLSENVTKNVNNKFVEFIRMRAMTVQAKIAGNGYEEVEFYAHNDDLINTGIAKTSRPGTSFQREIKTANNQERRLATTTLGSRTGTAGRCRTAHSALLTASRLSRAATAAAAGSTYSDAPVILRFISEDDKYFLPAAKTLFEYIFYCESNVRKAIEVIFQVKKLDEKHDWWWSYSLARCYYALGMHRNTEDCLRRSLKQHKHISVYLRLVAMYVNLNQPLSALDVCKQGLSVFHEYTPLLLEEARIHEMMGNSAVAVKYYRMVALQNPSNMEAVANIAMYNFYNDQPEIALRYYRRILATHLPGPEIYNNLGLCCLYCNQWDLIIPCFRQALYFSTSLEARSNIWFNLAHVSFASGDLILARRCLQNSLAITEHPLAQKALLSLNSRVKPQNKEVL
ncbi:tetratricopeptide repeat protein 8 [Pieris rapae]|uniref:tetratricopeptide repeat protein 8 n=1 Tax=Pieris rapae TaxID=64459 RepID=UPI001E2800DD|nr:tetratricopeptide repeat protein 8 [Pieris rapae]